MRYSIIACFLTVILVGPALSKETITWQDNVKGWSIKVDPSIGDGCFMFTTYEQGTTVRAQFNMNEENFQFIVADSDWQSLESGKLYDLEVQFGKLVPWTGLASVYRFSDTLPALVFDVSFDDGNAKLFIDEFMRMTDVRVSYSGNVIANLALSGTYAAMQEVIACQASMLDGGGERSADPFSSKPRNDPFE